MISQITLANELSNFENSIKNEKLASKRKVLSPLFNFINRVDFLKRNHLRH